MTLQHLKISQPRLRKAAEAVSCISSSFCFTLCNDEPHKSAQKSGQWITSNHISRDPFEGWRFVNVALKCHATSARIHCQTNSEVERKQECFTRPHMAHCDCYFGSLRPFWPIVAHFGPRLSWCVSWRRCLPLSSKDWQRIGASDEAAMTSSLRTSEKYFNQG